MVEKTKQWQKFEVKIEGFLRKNGFSDVAHNPEGFRFNDSRCQIDAIGGDGADLLIVECRTQEEEGPSVAVKNWVALINGRRQEYERAVKAHPKYRSYRKVHLVLAVSKDVLPSDLQRKYAKDLNVAIWDSQYISYYEKQPTALKEVTRYNILSDVGASVSEDLVHTAIAFKTKISLNGSYFNAYSFFTSPHEIIKYCYVARREHGTDDYYQRLITPSRLEAVAKYISSGGSFVNNIIVAYDPLSSAKSLNFTPVHKHLDKIAKDELMNKLNSADYNLEIGLLQFPVVYKSFWVIDGQHRLFGYCSAVEPSGYRATVPVVLIEELPAMNQMRLFVDINHEQKSINANLIWDIKGDTEPSSVDGAVSNLVKNIDDVGILKGRIKIPSRRGKAPINLSAMCRAIIKTGLMKKHIRWVENKDNPFFNDDPVITAENICPAFEDFLKTLKETFDDVTYKKLILHSTSIEILIAVFSLLSLNTKAKDTSVIRSQKYKQWVTHLENSIDKRTADNMRKATGEALKDDMTKTLFNIIAEAQKDPILLDINKHIARHVSAWGTLETELRWWIVSLFDHYSIEGITFDSWFARSCPRHFDRSTYEGVKRNFNNRDPHLLKHAKVSDFLTLGHVRALLKEDEVRDIVLAARAEIGSLSVMQLESHLNLIIPDRNSSSHGTPMRRDISSDVQVQNSVGIILDSIEKYREYFAEDNLDDSENLENGED